MNLNDYDGPPDPYAPRPKASQAVAAAKRAAQPGRPTHDTEPIAPLATRTRYAVPFGIGAALLIALMIMAASYQLARLPGAQPLAITPSAQAFASASAVAAQNGAGATEAPMPTPQAMINAYAAPDGLLLGQIELDRMILPVAHYGSGWIQADVAGSGLIWLRAADVPDVAIVGPDLAPVAAQPPQTGHGPNVSDWTPPEAPSAPESAPPAAEPTPAIVWATSAPAKVQDFDDPDVRGTCQFVGCLGAKAVALERAELCHALHWQYGDADPETIPEPDLSAVRGCIWEGLYR